MMEALKATMFVEQFDNGISIKEQYADGTDERAIVSLEHNQFQDIGELIMSDIKALMDGSLCNKVSIEINIEPYYKTTTHGI